MCECNNNNEQQQEQQQAVQFYWASESVSGVKVCMVVYGVLQTACAKDMHYVTPVRVRVRVRVIVRVSV